MKVAAKSDVGRVRTNNEDRLLIDAPLGLLIVADGMGGHAGGEVASAIAITAIAAYVKNHLVRPAPTNQTAALLQAAIRTADEAIWTHAHMHLLRHQITRSLGSREAVADLLSVAWQGGDYLLLCSDGLTNMVEDRHIEELILQGDTDVQAACGECQGGQGQHQRDSRL
jgi:serine/threonine protein phosphatase PrpC